MSHSPNNFLGTWQEQLSSSIHSLEQLYAYLELTPQDFPALFFNKNLSEKAAEHFKIKVPLAYAQRITKKNPQDPLLLQVLAQPAEQLETPGYTKDALSESAFNPLPGLLHKYHGRVLIMLHGTCAIHCRYCFRRNFPYDQNRPGKLGLEKILNYLNQDASIQEIILSGGDPLINSDSYLENLIREFNQIPHLKTLRFHTRIPVVLPDRITDNFVKILNQFKGQLVMVLHSNSAQEIDQAVKTALKKLRPSMTLLNQAVLLKNINHTKDQQINLHKTLFESGVLPYYLHVLDKVEGTAHFDMTEQEALKLIQEIQAELPGYLVPKLAREIPYQKSKITFQISHSASA